MESSPFRKMQQMNKNVLIAWICWWWWVQNEWNDCLSCPASASGKVWPCCEEGGGWNGGPWHQVWRLCVLHPTCGHLPVAHLPDCWCQVCTHGRSAEKGKHTLLMVMSLIFSRLRSASEFFSLFYQCDPSLNSSEMKNVHPLLLLLLISRVYQRAYLIH